jgi:hypothetical protein
MLTSDQFALNQQLTILGNQIDAQMDEVRKQADILGVPVEQARFADGSFMLMPLLLAKAQVLSARVHLNK